MKISRHIYGFYNRLLLPAVVGVLAVSCIDDSSLCLEDQPDYDATDNVWLSFVVKNQGVTGIDRSATRAEDTPADGSGHTPEEATEDENYISPSDLTLVLFDNNGKAMKTISNDELRFTSFDAINGNYTVAAPVNRAYFKFAAGSMSILAVANAHGINSGLSADDYTAVPWQASLGDITKGLRKFQYNGLTTNGDPWLPSQKEGRHIPMAGFEKGILLNEETLTELDAATTPETAFELSSIVMQRAMSKIRVLDGLQEQTGLRNFTRIENVEFLNGTEYGAIVPNVNRSGITSWGQGTTIVETATKPETTGAWHNTSEDFKFPFKESGNFQYTDEANTQHNLTQWICYTPEMQVKNLTGFTSEQKPCLRITTQTYSKTNQTQTVGDPKTHTVLLEDVLDGNDIVRNHIYQFHVTMNEFSSELEVNVLDWEKNEVTWDYADNPGMGDGHIRWEGFETLSYPTATGYFYQDQSRSVTGTFTIASPLGATWRASLITLSGEQNAFVFIDSEGNPVETVSGYVDGDPDSVTIKPRNAPGSETNSARVQFTITTVDNRTMIIDMLDGGPYGDDRHYFTIVQNPHL